MGFCRRCGDIVVGPRCKCGGTPVAPVVQWNQLNSNEQVQDRWSKTYVTKEKYPTRTQTLGPSVSAIAAQLTGDSNNNTDSGSSSPTKRFPRPTSVQALAHPIPMNARVSAHIASTVAQVSRPPSPLKQFTVPAPESDILPCPNTSSLLKVYGSILQPKESLATHSCVICFSTFPPDATIYPDPNNPSSSTRFLCRPCFITNGGSKGNCPACARPVLTLKSEGGFISAAGKFWHKRCFRCDGCFKDIGDTPMVDLFGKPSCTECFDGCLNRDPTTPKKWESPRAAPSPSGNLGGMKGEKKSREGSPAIEELEHRLGIVKSRENSPALEELSQRLSMVTKKSEESPTRSPLASRYSTGWEKIGSIPSNIPLSSRYSLSASKEDSPLTAGGRDWESPTSEKRFKSPSATEGCPSPTRSGTRSPLRLGTSSPKPTEDAVEEMKKRFLRGSSSSPAPSPRSSEVKSSTNSPSTAPLRSRSSTSYSSPVTKSPIPSKIPVSTSSGRFGLGASVRRESDVRGEGRRESGRYNRRESGSRAGREESMPSTPDLMSDCSDTTTQSSELNSPPRDDDVFDGGTIRGRGQAGEDQYEYRYIRGDFLGDGGGSMVTPTHTPKSKTVTTSLTNTRSPPSAKPPPSNIPSSQMLHPNNTAIPKSSISTNTTCAKCGGGLFTLREGAEARFVTVPEEPRDSGQQPKTYHADCFKCAVCEGVFKEGGKGQAIFIRTEGGPCHVECAPTEKVSVRRSIPRSNSVASIFSSAPTPAPSMAMPTSISSTSSTSAYSSSRYDGPPITPPTSTPFRRFGNTTACPGCHKSVSPMERGVVPGPQGTRWHATCLVCGGKQETKKGIWGRGELRKKGEPGCQKRLDSAAKGDGEGGVWCRECFLLLPAGMRVSPQASPSRSPTRPLIPSHTGGTGLAKVGSQYTGTTTIARQFTGVGKADAALMRQLTGGGVSPSRQLTSSPTKQLGMIGGRPRPKSVIGMRGGRSIDEGRGMYLVRQMTGNGG